MAKYLMLWKFKGETLQGFLKRPNDRSQAVDETARSVGGRLESYYWMLGGPHDGFAVLELPDSSAAARVALVIEGSGAFIDVQMQELFSAPEVMQMARDAKSVNYAAPGQAPDYLSHAMP